MVSGLFIISKGYIRWDFLKPYVNEIILYEYRVQIVWFINILIGLSHYYYVGLKKKESKYVIIQTSLPFIDSLLSVLSYGTIINSCFFLANEVVNGQVIGLDIDWLSLFIAVFIILFWCLKRLFDMGKQTWISYMEFSKGHSISVESTIIQDIDYNSNSSKLVVAFENGSQYEYSNVPSPIFQDFTKAKSKGKYFHDNIRDHYPYKRIT